MKFFWKLCAIVALGVLPLCSGSMRSVNAAEKSGQQGRQFIVCIDPGHPSETSDGASSHGLSENTLNWDVAVRLAKKLNAAGIAWVTTKSRLHQRVTNKQRAQIANGANRYHQAAAAFIRLHCDEGSGSGYTWYFPDRAGHKGGVTGPSKSVQQNSRSLAWTMNAAMKPVLRGSLQTNPIKTDASTFVGGKQGGVLTGSIYSQVPTALIEMCFINRKSDARFIASATGQEKMAEALLAGIKNWKRAWEKAQANR
jgi:N-acetylmuramoyl-L-alanine amidase